MSVRHYEVIDNLDKTISYISRNESIDRAQALKALQNRLTYQQRRIESLLSIGWIDKLKLTESESHKY